MPVRCTGGKPLDKKLYRRVTRLIKRRVKRWPSAYASGQLVREYKRRGGRYSCTKRSKRHTLFGSLSRWFKERWMDVCTGKPCGRQRSSKRRYPYCRPTRRVNLHTPRLASELSRSEIKRRCSKKRRIRGKRLK
jgi:hypothetical protein